MVVEVDFFKAILIGSDFEKDRTLNIFSVGLNLHLYVRMLSRNLLFQFIRKLLVINKVINKVSASSL